MIKLEWQKMPKADYIRIYVWIEHFGHWEIVEGSPKVVGEHGQWYDSFKVAGDGIYLIKLATVTCGQQRNLRPGQASSRVTQRSSTGHCWAQSAVAIS